MRQVGTVDISGNHGDDSNIFRGIHDVEKSPWHYCNENSTAYEARQYEKNMDVGVRVYVHLDAHIHSAITN